MVSISFRVLTLGKRQAVMPSPIPATLDSQDLTGSWTAGTWGEGGFETLFLKGCKIPLQTKSEGTPYGRAGS